ncbi:hypothetical protein P9112_012645 [Eukaryota sp. TZLM1-RC]
MLTVTLPDGSTREVEANSTPYALAKSISNSLAKTVVAAKVNDVVVDLTRPLTENCSIKFLKFDDPEGHEVFWHSAAHVLGEALQRVFNAKLCIGPAVEMGFYYDCHFDGKISDSDLPRIQAECEAIVKERQPFERIEATKEECLEMFKDNPFKLEIIQEQIKSDEVITVYKCGSFIDLCRGPHLPDTGYIKAFWVNRCSSAYWRGDQSKESLQRVYGVAFPDKKQLKEHQKILEEAAKRDHRVLGSKQKLFFFSDLSPGSPFFLPHGTRIYRKLEQFIRNLYRKYGYDEVQCPNMFDHSLWITSGHWQFYKDDMFTLNVDKNEWALKPMNCPGHCLLFKHQKHSYRELPFRCAEFGVLHRNEASGALSGLSRVRRFVQDDAHIFCRRDQIYDEVLGVLRFVEEVYGILDLPVEFVLSTRPEKFLGDLSVWEAAEDQLTQSLKDFGKAFDVDPQGGAFYGPKIDINVTDALKRKHQCATIQLDFNMPERFDLTFNAEEGYDRPVMIHRAILGSLERFMAMALEHLGGKWPFWLSPRQICVVPVSSPFDGYAEKVRDVLHNEGFFVDADLSNRKLAKKVREAQLEQYNYILVVGAEEQEKETVNIRTRDNVVHGERTIQEAVGEFKEALVNFK